MYNKKEHIHFVGIGGIGMSGIANILKSQGYTISGCDLDLEQKSVKDLVSIGCKIYKGNNTALCADKTIDILVYSSAVNSKNQEILNAQAQNIPTIPRALMLAELMRTKFSIAIAGSHGKTTTTSLISHILIESEKDPTVIIGGHLKSISNNARLGHSDYLVAESDESDRSFLHLYPTLAVVTNIDMEHLDTYSDLRDIKKTFKRFLSNLPFYGKAIVCVDDQNIRSLLPITHIKTIKYGIDYPAQWQAKDIILNPENSIYNLYNNNILIQSITVNIPGKHNILNSLAAIAITHELGVNFNQIASALANFKGIERRFSFKGTYRDAEFFDDYGHHPTEIENTLPVAKNRTKNKLTVIFQLHRYTRTEKLWQQFIEVFKASKIDNLIITDIYPASEQSIPGITGQNFADALKNTHPNFSVTYAPYDPELKEVQKALDPLIQKDDLILTLGAGKVNKLIDLLDPENK